MKIYTRGGDRGETSLLGGDRVPKHAPRIEAYGTVDELNAAIGVARATSRTALDAELERIQSDLFVLGAMLAAPGLSDRFPGVATSRVTELEEAIDHLEKDLPPLTAFVLPGGSLAAAQLHVARTVCRRAERLIVALAEGSEVIDRAITYVNRLSDWLFVASRWANHDAGVADVPWKP